MAEQKQLTRRQFLIGAAGLAGATAAAKTAEEKGYALSTIFGAFTQGLSYLDKFLRRRRPDDPPADPDMVARWDKQSKEYEKYDASEVDPDIIFGGTSSFYRMGEYFKTHPDHKFFHGKKFLVRGFSGALTHRDLLPRTKALIGKHKPKAFVLFANNDATVEAFEPEDIVNDIDQVVDELLAESPNTQIFVVENMPSPDRWRFHNKQEDVNRILASRGSNGSHQGKYTVIKMYDRVITRSQNGEEIKSDLFDPSDNIHLNPKGEEEILIPALEEVLQ